MLGLVLSTLFLATTSSPAPISEQFDRFKQTHNRAYKSAEDEASRLSIFAENLAYIEAENEKPERTFWLGVGEFADWTNDEFAAHLTSEPLSRAELEAIAPVDKNLVDWTGKLPVDVDWVAAGAVTGVKNQGKCGSCWAFSTVGAIEGLTFLEGNNTLVSLSEQTLVSCDKKGNHGCKGGNMAKAMGWVHTHGGLPAEKTYHYSDAKGGKKACNQTLANNTVFTIGGHKSVPHNNETALAVAVSRQPISIAIQANQPGFQHYKSGIFHGKCGDKTDHGVTLVGYGVDKNVTAGANASWCEADGCRYWTVKNSWTHHWGDHGYIRMARGLKHVGECGLATQAAFPINGTLV
jgi:C1A family cysteine protease